MHKITQVATVFLFAIAAPATAMMVDVPLPKIVLDSDLIVIAKVSANAEKAEKEAQIPGMKQPIKRWFQESELTIEKVLRDRQGAVGAAEKQQKVSVTSWAAAPQKPGLMIHMADGPAYPNLQVGQRYLLVLKKMSNGKGYYLPPYPKNFALANQQNSKRVAEMEKLAKIDDWGWGKERNGLQLALVPAQTKLNLMKSRRGRNGPFFWRIYVSTAFVVRNATADKTLGVNLYPSDKCLSLKYKKPDGKVQTSDLYAFLARSKVKPFGKENVAILKPGEVAMIAPYGPGGYGQPFDMETGPGEMIVQLGYESKRDATVDGVTVWKGKLSSQAVTLEVVKPGR